MTAVNRARKDLAVLRRITGWALLPVPAAASLAVIDDGSASRRPA
jgi:hypothetical protein